MSDGAGALANGGKDGNPGISGATNGGGVEQAANVPTIKAVAARRRSANFMGLILLEALLALAILLLIVWWTMFSGRKRGEIKPPKSDDTTPPPA